MGKLKTFSLYICLVLFLSSCTMRCSVGDVPEDEPKGEAKIVDGARLYNDIILETSGVKVEKAYLVFENGDRVPKDNVVAFDQPVHLKIFVEDGWTEKDGRVNLGVEEKISAPDNDVILHEQDLFSKYPDGLPAKDSKIITVIAKIILKQKIQPLSTFGVSFRVWDKNSSNYIKGSYKLFSK